MEALDATGALDATNALGAMGAMAMDGMDFVDMMLFPKAAQRRRHRPRRLRGGTRRAGSTGAAPKRARETCRERAGSARSGNVPGTLWFGGQLYSRGVDPCINYALPQLDPSAEAEAGGILRALAT